LNKKFKELKMFKLFTLTVIFILTTIYIHPQRNESTRTGSTDSDRIHRIERKPETTSTDFHRDDLGHEKTRNGQTTIYPDEPTPVMTTSVPVEDRPFICTVPSPVQNMRLGLNEYQQALQAYELGDYYVASLKFSDWLVLYPKDISARFYRGICYIEIEWFTYAIEDFNFVIRLDPEMIDAYYYRGLSKFYNYEKVLAKMDFEIAYELGHSIAGIILRKYY
jgi:TolA-binding protein